MQKYKSNITSTTGAAIRNVPVTVLNEAGELASLFLDRAGAIAAPNPLVTDSSGNFYFYAVNGRYSLRTTVEGVTITDDDVVLLQDPEEITVAGPIAEAVAAVQAAARQAQDVVDSSGIPDMVAAAQNAVIDSNQALQEARGASLASAEAKLAAESAKSAAELAKGDAQTASSTANTAAQHANAAAQSAAQSAASIDPARLLTPAERQKLEGIGAATAPLITDIDSLRAYGVYRTTAAVMLAAGGPESDCVIFHLPGSTANSGHRQIAFPITSSGTYIGREYSRAQWGGAWQPWHEPGMLGKANTWTAQQRFDNGTIISRLGINGSWSSNVGAYCLDNEFAANASISGINFDIGTDTTALSAARVHRAAYLRVKGNKSVINLAGNTLTLTGAEAVGASASAVDGEGEFTNLYGLRAYATDNSSRSGTANLSVGGWFLSEHQGTGTIGKSTTQSIGVSAGVTNNNPSSSVNIAVGVYSLMANTQGAITSGYLYRGTFSGPGAYGVKWGIHLAGSMQNQIDGWLNLTDTTESTSTTTGALRIAGGLGVAKNLIVGGDLGLSDAAKITIRHIAWSFGTYGGTANAITLTSVYPQTSLVRGQTKTFRATAVNTGATTINVDGLGAITAVTVTGSGLPAGYIRTDVDTVARFDGTYWVVDRQVQYGNNVNGTFILRADGSATILATPNITSNSIAANTPVVYSGIATPTSLLLSKPTAVFAQINPGLSPDFMYGYAQMAGSNAIAAVGKNGANVQNITFTSYSAQGYWY
ncbi:hypothetical protein [Comamonas terrigena]|uniref:hypothetical protein n=1 Tax=Comamonas terrigena TaxID=32013 RepID=UPI0028A6CB75|nr:hypothetical protein [Comamonas terrigena]